jgi:hypothetical protein
VFGGPQGHRFKSCPRNQDLISRINELARLWQFFSCVAKRELA